MSIRLWLLVADCWMCGTSIELTEEQERVRESAFGGAEKGSHEAMRRRPLQQSLSRIACSVAGPD